MTRLNRKKEAVHLTSNKQNHSIKTQDDAVTIWTRGISTSLYAIQHGNNRQDIFNYLHAI